MDPSAQASVCWSFNTSIQLQDTQMYVEIVHSIFADACIPALDKILYMSYFGITSEITIDIGTSYNSEQFKQYAKYMGLKHTKKIPYTS